MKQLFLAISALIIFSFAANAQYSPFSSLTKQAKEKFSAPSGLSPHAMTTTPVTVSLPTTINAWRFEGPTAVYVLSKGGSQAGTALSFGYHHEVLDSATKIYSPKWYIDGTIVGAASISPSLTNPQSIMTAGVIVGFQLGNISFNVGPGYNLPSNFLTATPNATVPPTKGSIALIVSATVSL